MLQHAIVQSQNVTKNSDRPIRGVWWISQSALASQSPPEVDFCLRGSMCTGLGLSPHI